jgi:hypothetical protein
MPMSSSNMSIESVKATIHGLESARPEGKTGTESGSKILHTTNATYSGKKK